VHVIDVGWTSVCPSVCLSVARWYCVETAQKTYCQTVFTACSLHDSSFLRTKLFPGIPMGTSPTGELNAMGRKKVAISDQNLAIGYSS